jgi:hypothetical protein
MKTRNRKLLSLSKETLKTLQSEDLSEVGGASYYAMAILAPPPPMPGTSVAQTLNCAIYNYNNLLIKY